MFVLSGNVVFYYSVKQPSAIYTVVTNNHITHMQTNTRTGLHCSRMRTETYALLPPTEEEVNVFASVCLFVCLSVSKITQKRVHGFG